MAGGQIIGALLRLRSALFAKGGDMTLPATDDPTTGQTQEPVTVSVPHGIARDPTVLILFLAGIIYRGLGLIGIELPFTAADLNGWLEGGAVIVAGIIARVKSRNITRG